MMLLARKMMGGKKPTLFATDFSEYAVGAQPSDWSKPWSSTGYTALVQSISGSLSGKALRWTKTAANDFQLLKWDKIPPTKNMEVLFRARRNEAAASAQDHIGVLMRGSGVLSTARGVKLTSATYLTASRMLLTTNPYTGGAKGTQELIVQMSEDTAVNAWYFVRVSLIEGALKVTLWNASGTEAPTLITADPVTILDQGFVGLINTAVNPNVEIDYFAVDIAAKTIPLPI